MEQNNNLAELKRRMAKWDEYAIKEAKEQAYKESYAIGFQLGYQRQTERIVKNMLATGEFTIAEIAKYADVTEYYVRKVKKNLK